MLFILALCCLCPLEIGSQTPGLYTCCHAHWDAFLLLLVNSYSSFRSCLNYRFLREAFSDFPDLIRC